MGYVSLLIWSLCIPRNGHVTVPFSLVRIYGHYDYDHLRHHGLYDDSSLPISAHHLFALLHYSHVLLFYDHAITILMTPMTHIFSYLSLTLPSLSLDLHSFDYLFLSCLCLFLLSLPHSLCNHSIFTYDVLSSKLSGFRLPPNQNSGCPDDQPNIRAPGDDNQTTEMCWNISKN